MRQVRPGGTRVCFDRWMRRPPVDLNAPQRQAQHLRTPVRVGVLAADAEGDIVLPHSHRGAVARGVWPPSPLLGDSIETD